MTNHSHHIQRETDRGCSQVSLAQLLEFEHCSTLTLFFVIEQNEFVIRKFFGVRALLQGPAIVRHPNIGLELPIYRFITISSTHNATLSLSKKPRMALQQKLDLNIESVRVIDRPDLYPLSLHCLISRVYVHNSPRLVLYCILPEQNI